MINYTVIGLISIKKIIYVIIILKSNLYLELITQ